MADPQQSLAPLTDSLRSDVLLLSSYLDGKQSFPSEAHSKDATLSLYLRILTLLIVGNKSNLRAENVNAVIGETTPNAVQFLVCAENAKQHKDEARAVRQHIRGNPLQSGKDKGMDSPTESVEIAGENKEDSFPEKSADCLLHAVQNCTELMGSSRLLATCKTFVPGHSRHSSASSAASDAPLDQVTNSDKFPTTLSQRESLAYPIVIGWTCETNRQDNSSPSPMADPQQSPAPLTGSLRSDDATMSLYLHISTLLAIGNASNRRAENVNAIIGETSQTAVQFLGGNDKGMDSPTESVEIAAENKEGCANGAERPVIPNGVHGKELLEEWEEGASIGASTLANNFTFGAHLQDLFDVIVSLKPDFSTHWGKLPFDIISKCLAKSELESKDFTFKEVFNNAIQMHMPSRASSETNSKPVYCVNSDNALQWLNVVYTLLGNTAEEVAGRRET
ncbi:hypothetical protein BT96DRAFT_998416 [Gymnopus androsaceus JB14]|uniref:Uncharacterized protein n=1 Tax=Gymnopus androsaceus JB14 TaxID=1447944 RepID=A0A6A4HA53_9AGAR|nr:hypothetical protein BT96DRAFT_998416 [Gymnopus androsaceus JB14]